MFHLYIRILLPTLLVVVAPYARARICNPTHERCWLERGNSSSSPAFPSKNSNIKINPSAVPVENIWGGEVLYYDSDVDFALVKGTGRVGAAISPSNGEETFFGPMGFEDPFTFEKRMDDSKKYESQKITLAGAANIWNNKKNGLRRLQMNLGLLAKYNRESKDIWPGGGISIIGGPLTVGYSASRDNYLADLNAYGVTTHVNVKYWVETFSASIFLSSLALDYSHMRVHTREGEPAKISMLTGSLLLKRWILTAATRHETSERLAYDYRERTLVYEPEKYETFAGAQYALTKVMMVGLFHNYYLLREFSVGLTLFF